MDEHLQAIREELTAAKAHPLKAIDTKTARRVCRAVWCSLTCA
jgi:hypothetical protein